MNLPKNKPVLIGGGLLVLLMAACGYFLWTFSKQHSEQTEKLDKLKTSIQNVGRNGPPPNQDNVNLLQSQEQEMKTFYSNYFDNLFADLPERQEMAPDQFNELLNSRISQFDNYADKNNVKLGVPLPATGPKPGLLVNPNPLLPGSVEEQEEPKVVFTMDFDRYVKEGEQPEETNIPRLGQQLLILDDLVRLAVDSGVSRIVTVERNRFDGEARDPRNGNFNAPFIPLGVPGQQGLEEEDQILFENEWFKMKVVGKEASVLKTINQVNQLGYPATVTQIHLRNLNERLIPFQEDKPQGQANATPRFNQAQILGQEGLQEQDEKDLILAAGDESVEALIEVYIARPPEPQEEDTSFNPLGL